MRSLPERADVVIIGGGIIGTSIAYNLAKKGLKDIVLLEKGLMGEGSTGKCAGGIRTQFSSRINIEFSLLSMKVIDGFREEFGVNPEFYRTGYLFLATRSEQWATLEANVSLMRSLALQIDLLSPDELEDRWPFLYTHDLLGGSYSEQDGYAGPYEILQGYIKGARRMGVLLIEGIEVTGIVAHNGRVKAVETSTGKNITTPFIVNAAGPYGSGVAAMVGLDLPVMPLRRQIFFTDFFDAIPALFPVVIDMEYGWYMRREGRGLLLSGPQDSAPSFKENVDFEARLWTAERSIHRAPVLEQAKIAGGWGGLYEISPDRHAIIGSFPEMEGFICANGFSGHGFMHAPAAGILVSELIFYGETKTIDIYALRPSRFREGDSIYEPMTAFR